MHFGPPLRSNPLGELAYLRRTSTVQEYQQRFLALLYRTDQLTSKQQVQLFTAGLRNPLKIDVELQNPSNLQTAMSLAHAYEHRGEDDAADSLPPICRSSIGRSSAPIPHRLNKPVPINASTPAPAPGTTSHGSGSVNHLVPAPTRGPLLPTPATSKFQRLTPAEMNECRLQGLCYNRSTKFSRDHAYSFKGIYLLELDDADGSSESTDTEVQISLHAITGVSTGRTMKLRVSVQGVLLTALVDSGSTHNFLADGVAERIGVCLSPLPRMKVTVANGDRVASLGVHRGLRIDINDEFFHVDCYALPLEGFDVVLGVQWLRTLGPIIWDFDRLTMSFWWQDHQVIWHNITTYQGIPRVHASSPADVLADLLLEFASLFDAPQGLSPSRRQDHHIHLLPGTAPVAVRPYRYPLLLKDKI